MEKRAYVWTIGAIIYVLGMFPLFYVYSFQGDAGYGLIDLIATFGGFVVMFGQAFMVFLPSGQQKKRTSPSAPKA